MMLFFRRLGVRVCRFRRGLADHAQAADAAQVDFGGNKLEAVTFPKREPG